MKTRLIIGIGPGKSGSTWLFTFLRSSKKIRTSTIKETGYFLTSEQPEIEQYLHRFYERQAGDSIFAEVSNTYIYYPLIITRLGLLDAEIDLVAILRDPIERAISHVRHLARNGEKFNSFEDAIYQRPDILSRGLYGQYLSQFESAPQNIRLHIFDFQELKNNEETFKENFAERLGLNPADFSVFEARRFKGARARSKTIARLVKRLATLARHLGFTNLIQRVKESWIPEFLYIESESIDGADHLSPRESTLDFMKEYFRQADSLVGSRWNIDVSEWKSQLNE